MWVEHLPHKQKVLGLNPQSPCKVRCNTRFLQLQRCYRTKDRDTRNLESLQAREPGIDSGPASNEREGKNPQAKFPLDSELMHLHSYM